MIGLPDLNPKASGHYGVARGLRSCRQACPKFGSRVQDLRDLDWGVGDKG